MIDRQARNLASAVLEEFKAGAISNDEYESRYPKSDVDSALWEISMQVWFLYSDLKTHTLSGKYTLTDAQRNFIDRCLLFLKSDLEFEWPRQKITPLSGIRRLLGMERPSKKSENEHVVMGEEDVWPFFNKADYEQMSSG